MNLDSTQALRPRRDIAPGLATLAACMLLAGCRAPDREAMDVPRDLAEATGLPAAVEFIEVGPDGGPLDEPQPAGEVLTLADAMRRAVTTDPGLQMALARVRLALADADQARLLPNPVLSLVLRWGPGKPQIEASLAQELVRAFERPRRASAADHRLRKAAADAVTAAIDVAAEVQERYATAQAAVELVPVLEDRMKLLHSLGAVAKSRLEAGEGTRADLVTLDAQRVELQVEIDQALLTERESRLRLARLIGEPSSAASWRLEAWAAPGGELPAEERWIRAALQCRPEIQAVVWELRALGDEAALRRLAAWEGADAGLEAQRDGEWFAGPAVSAPLPLFDDGDAGRARVHAEQLEARHQLTLARRTVVEEVRVAYQVATASRANLARLRDELIPLQRRRLSIAEDVYRAGQSDVTGLFLAEQDLRLTQAKAIDVERQAATAIIRLQRAVGGPGVAAGLAQGPPAAAPPDRPGPPAR